MRTNAAAINFVLIAIFCNRKKTHQGNCSKIVARKKKILRVCVIDLAGVQH